VLGRILSGEDPVLQTPDGYGAQSVAARGLYALETMLYDPAFNDYGPNDPGCILVEAISADLANTAAQVRDQWVNDFAAVMRTAGEPGNTQFLDVTEARQTVFTALMTSIQFDILERLGLPMGSFDQPRPSRAEGRLSGRSQRNLELSIAAHEKLAAALVADAALSTIEDFERARWMASQIGDPDFSGVQEPVGRFKLESLQTTLTLLRAEANREIGAVLGVTLGLNALDGD
jgi:predicted lipoprotein